MISHFEETDQIAKRYLRRRLFLRIADTEEKRTARRMIVMCATAGKDIRVDTLIVIIAPSIKIYNDIRDM